MGYGRSEPDVEGERILEYALAFDLLLGNTCFKKRDSHLITYKSGNAARQIDLRTKGEGWSTANYLKPPSNFYCWPSQGGSSVLVLWSF